VPQRTAPLSNWFPRAAASRLGNRSSPSESLTKTVSRSRRDSTNSPSQERFRLDSEAALDRLRKFLRIAERRVDAARTTRRDEVHHVVEIAMVAQRELRVDPEPPREVEHRSLAADIRGPQPGRPHPRRAVVDRWTAPAGGPDARLS